MLSVLNLFFFFNSWFQRLAIELFRRQTSRSSSPPDLKVATGTTSSERDLRSVKSDDDSQTTMSNAKKGEEEERTQLDDSNVRVEYRTSHIYAAFYLSHLPWVGLGVLSWNIHLHISVSVMHVSTGCDCAVAVLRRSCLTVTWTVWQRKRWTRWMAAVHRAAPQPPVTQRRMTLTRRRCEQTCNIDTHHFQRLCSSWDCNLGRLNEVLLNHLHTGLERMTSTSLATWRQKKESFLMTWLGQQVNPTHPQLRFYDSQWNCTNKYK